MKRLIIFILFGGTCCLTGCKNTSVPHLTMAEQMDLPNDVKDVSYICYRNKDDLEPFQVESYLFREKGMIDQIIIKSGDTGMERGSFQFQYDGERLMNVNPCLPLADKSVFIPENVLRELLYQPFNPGFQLEKEAGSYKIGLWNGDIFPVEEIDGLYKFKSEEHNYEAIVDRSLQLQSYLLYKDNRSVDTAFMRTFIDGKQSELKDGKSHYIYTYNEKGLVASVTDQDERVFSFHYKYDDRGNWTEVVIDDSNNEFEEYPQIPKIIRKINYGVSLPVHYDKRPIIDGDWMTIVDDEVNGSRAIITMDNVDFSREYTKTFGELIWKVQLEGGLPLTFGAWDFVYYRQIDENTAIIGIRDKETNSEYCSQTATMKREGDNVTLSDFRNNWPPEAEKDTYILKFPYDSITF